MTAETLTIITQVSTAILAVSGVIALGYSVFLRPRMIVVDESLQRIEAHLAAINGSIGRTNEWQHEHELSHARSER